MSPDDGDDNTFIFTYSKNNQNSWDQLNNVMEFEFDIGRYDELRPGMYSTDLFSDGRFLHIGIDVGGPVGTPCMAFEEGEFSYFGYNPADGDYGNTLVTKHLIEGRPIWALYGHLNSDSIADKEVGQKI